MKTVSLTTFTDFVVKSGSPKQTIVANHKAHEAEPYHPAFDFWKALRNAIVAMHRDGTGKQQLTQVATSQSHGPKRKRYPQVAKAYNKFLGTKQFSWFEPGGSTWECGVTKVRVNPELGLQRNGSKEAVKLYFKEDKLVSARVSIILQMMRTVISDPAVSPVLLDVPRGKAYRYNAGMSKFAPLLAGEALCFSTIYDSL